MTKVNGAKGKGPNTLCIDIGGTGIKAMVVGPAGEEVSPRARVETPRPATPAAILATIKTMVAAAGSFDRVSVGFPGVVVDGVTQTAPNLDKSWTGVKLAKEIEKLTGKPTRALNDAGVQGHGVIEGKGTEMCLTLGTGMGCALYVDGNYVPNLELAHHPLRKGLTYEEYIGMKALKKVGKGKWNKRVERVLGQVQPIFNPRVIYLGGGNAKKLKIELPKNVKIVENVAGLLGGVKLWDRA